LPAAKFTLRPSLAFSYIGSVTARHSSSGCQPNFVAWYGIMELSLWAPPIFGWPAITLGIGSHCSFLLLSFSSFILSGRRLDVYDIRSSIHDVALVRI